MPHRKREISSRHPGFTALELEHLRKAAPAGTIEQAVPGLDVAEEASFKADCSGK